MSEEIKNILIVQLESHFANFVYVLFGMAIFLMMYLMADCMYTKEVGMLILGWVGVLISGKRSEGTSSK